MNTIILFFIFLAGLLLTPIVEKLALSLGIADVVDGDPLKIHTHAIPLMGGLVIMLLFISGVIYFTISSFLRPMVFLLSGVVLIFAIGLWDDIHKVHPDIRLGVHILVGILVVFAGYRVQVFPVSIIAVLLTLFYIAGAVNAFNVVDGMDGLCAGLSLISSCGFFFIGIRSGNLFLVVISSILFMSLLGFLPYNFYPAKIFLGDAGSGLLGFLLGTMAVIATNKPLSIGIFIGPILIIGVPVFDLSAAIIRRGLRKKPLFTGDRDHSYDLLLKKGVSQPKVWTIFCLIQIILVVVGIVIY